MKICLIEALDATKPSFRFTHIGLAYLIAWIKRQCASFCEVELAYSAAEVVAAHPDVVGISAVSSNYPAAVDLAATIKAALHVPLIFGGAHITNLPTGLPEVFDVGVIGEGEQTLQQLLETLHRAHTFTSELLGEIPGIVFYRDGQLCQTTPRTLLEPLDQLPFPQRQAAANSCLPQWSFSSRGCPYSCTFCSTSKFWQSYRSHSASYIVRELNELIAQFDPSMHIFMDDLFAANARRLQQLADEFTKSLAKPLPLTVTVRADTATEEICQLLSKLNVAFCHLGLESASEKVLQYLKNHTISVERSQRALDLLQEYGIKAIGSFIIGAPNENEEDLQQTYDFIERNCRSGKLTTFSFGALVPFPGTGVWNQAQKLGLVDSANFAWSDLDIDVRNFNIDKYLLLSPLPRPRFKYWFDKFSALWQEALGNLG